MKFDMHVKNIRNMKFNGLFSKFTPKKEIYEKFEEFLFKLGSEKLCINEIECMPSLRYL